MNVPVLTKLQSNFGNIMKLTDIRTKLLKRQIRKPKWTALWPQVQHITVKLMSLQLNALVAQNAFITVFKLWSCLLY